MKFNVEARFHDTIATVKSLSSFEIYKNSEFLTEITVLLFFRKLEFFGVSQIRSDRRRGATHDPHRAMCPLLIWVRFCLETIYFIPIQVQYILNELYLINFPLSIFFSHKFRFWGPSGTRCPKICENLTLLEFSEICLSN